MAPGADDPTCHLLRLPYELLKPIISKLTQKDQLSASKTCVHLWELAYPVVYDRITVKIGPDMKDSAWSNLASGIGICYVQHLKILSLYDSSDKPRNMEDLIARTLIAALRRNQLLSFAMNYTSWSPGTILIKTVIILLETQQHLKSVELPSLTRPNTKLVYEYLPSQILLPQLGATPFAANERTDSSCSLYDIVQKLPRLDQFNVRCSPLGGDIKQSFRSISLCGPPSRYALLSCATSITLQGYDFTYMDDWESIPSFPVMRAMALVDCCNDRNLLRHLEAKVCPKLDALMVTGQATGMSANYGDFLLRLNPLRELVLVGDDCFGVEITGLFPHVESLELLCIHASMDGSDIEAFYFDTSTTADMLDRLINLRHWSSHVSTSSTLDENGHIMSPESGFSQYFVRTFAISQFHDQEAISLTKSKDIVSRFDNLRTLNVSCEAWVNLPYVHGGRRIFSPRMALFEKLLGEEIADNITYTHDTNQAVCPSDYLAVTITCKVMKSLIQPATTLPKIDKGIYSFKPSPTFRSTNGLKEELMDKYASDGYHFFENYIDIMMKPSEIRLR